MLSMLSCKGSKQSIKALPSGTFNWMNDYRLCFKHHNRLFSGKKTHTVLSY